MCWRNVCLEVILKVFAGNKVCVSLQKKITVSHPSSGERLSRNWHCSDYFLLSFFTSRVKKNKPWSKTGQLIYVLSQNSLSTFLEQIIFYYRYACRLGILRDFFNVPPVSLTGDTPSHYSINVLTHWLIISLALAAHFAPHCLRTRSYSL